MRSRRQIPSESQESSAEQSRPSQARRRTFDRTYLAIGTLCLLSGIFTLVDFIFLCMSYTLF